ncbi:hypothetical protein Cgig2_024594 [Carnegiea gigantea]|uniref:Uncharacterized protein n=1 Tax=Carnegiea gigantea TaxID=171969 RepID=A0A9Q1QIW0_9CARY|nr:hypothetical protein Cgig2_024594 [Carnegiea gigantea]
MESTCMLAHVPLPSRSHRFPSIEHLPSLGPDFLSSGLWPNDSTSICTPNDDDKAKSTPLADAPQEFCTRFERLHCLKGKFDSLYDLINERGGDATPLKNKVERLIHQARDLKDLQESYFDQMSTRVRKTRHIEDLTCHVVAREDLLQEADLAVIDLQGQIDTFNAIEVIDLATKANLEKTKACIKESFGDL